MNETDFSILEYMADGRDVIMEGEALLQRVRDGERPRSSARKVFDGVLKEINRSRSFALAPEFAGCRESLEVLANDLEALREGARRLL